MKRNKRLEEIRARITPEQHEKYDKIIEEMWNDNGKTQIFKKVIRRLKENTNYSVGICQHLRYSCTEEEFPKINAFLLSNKPEEILSDKWWWTMDKEGHQKRIEFLEELIKKL